ncbi:MAG: MMPL family transporter [Thermodesulfovibrionales bacterium]|nr:MMPL family transporter [Thermodesulfovibrionales bacterium]
MEKLVRFSYDKPWIIILITALLTIALAVPALQLKIDVSSDRFMARDTPEKKRYEETKKVFGSDVLSFVYIRDTELFTEKKLNRLRLMFDRLANLKGVEKAESLFTINNIKGQEGIIDTAPLLDIIPGAPDELLSKQKDAIENPVIHRNFISPDGKSTVISLYLSRDKKDDKFDSRIKKGIEDVIASYRGDFQEIFQTGAPYVNTSMSEYIVDDQLVLVPIGVIALLLTIMLTLGNYHGAMVPLVNAAISIFWTFGFMKLFGVPINPLTAIVPAIMIVIGATEDTHMVAEFLDATSKGESPRDAVLVGIGRKFGIAFFLTALTTVIGFGSIAFTDVVILQDFGIASGIGFFLNFFVTITMTPVYLRFFGKSIMARGFHEDTKGNKLLNAIVHKVVYWGIHYRKRIIIASSSLLLISLAATAFIYVNNDVISYFRKSSPIVKAADKMHENLSGQNIFYIVFEKDTGDFKTAAGLKKIEEAEAYLRNLKVFDAVLGLPDYIALVNKGMQNGNPAFHKVPDSDNLISQYLLFFQRNDIERFVSGDFSKVNIMVRHNINSSTELNNLVAKIKKDLNSSRYGKYSNVLIIGEGILISDAAENFISGQITSLATTAVMIAAIMAFLFMSWKAGFIVLIPNLLPVAIFFGLMGIAGIPLNAGTVMVAAVTIGIAVDDTTVFMVLYNQNLKKYGDEKKALEDTLLAEIKPIFISSVSLAAGFGTLIFSKFVPIAQFGALSAFVMIVAFGTELFITPLTLSSVRLITLWDAIGLALRDRLIKQSILLQGLSKFQIRRLILMSHMRDARAGEQIICEGDAGDKMYLVVDGEMSVSKAVNGERKAIAKLEPGNVFGEIALVSSQPRTADVFAVTDAKLLSLDWKTLERLRRLSPFITSKLFLNISKILGNRLIETTDKMVCRL